MAELVKQTETIEATTDRTEDSIALGELLLKRGQVRRYQLDFALRLQKAYQQIQKNLSIGEILVQHRAISDRTRNEVLDIQKDIPLEGNTEIMKAVNETNETFVTQLIPMVTSSPRSLGQ